MAQAVTHHLVLDLGNSFTKAALFAGSERLSVIRFQHDDLQSLQNWLKGVSISAWMIGSVIHAQPALLSYLQELAPGIILDAQTPLPIQVTYTTPETLGSDRLANMVAAYDRFPGQAVMVIDVGTCLKYDVLLPEGVFTGGTIAPGIRMRLQAMHTFTDRLPLIELPNNIPLDISTITGNSTHASLLSGALEAACMEAEGMIRHYSLIFGHLTVLVTGGDAPFLASRLKSEIFAVPELVLDGLHVILGYNIKAP